MIGILLVTHGELGAGLIDGVRIIVGEVSNIDQVPLLEELSLKEYRQRIFAKTRQLDRGKGVLVFADIYGETPYNAARLNGKNFHQGQYQLIAGVNLPLLVNAVLKRETLNLLTLVKQLEDPQEQGIVMPEYSHRQMGESSD